MSKGNEPLRASKCSTCPFKEGSPYAYLADDLAKSAASQASRVCHQTGRDNAIHKRTGRKPHLCRGARDVQLEYMASVGVIDGATDEAWNEARKRINLPATVVCDPVK